AQGKVEGRKHLTQLSPDADRRGPRGNEFALIAVGLIAYDLEIPRPPVGAPMLAHPITGMRRAGRLQGPCLESLLRLYSLTIFGRIWIGSFAWIIIEDARHRHDRTEVEVRFLGRKTHASPFEASDLVARSRDLHIVITPVRHCSSPSSVARFRRARVSSNSQLSGRGG